MTGLPEIRQCALCQSVLPAGWRPLFCSTCRPAYQRERNRAKVAAFRERRRSGATTYERGSEREPSTSPARPSEDSGRPPNESEINWLQGLNLGLAGPVRQAFDLLSAGRTIRDPEVQGLARWIVARYDLMRPMLDQRASLLPDPEHLAESWRGFFESMRRRVS